MGNTGGFVRTWKDNIMIDLRERIWLVGGLVFLVRYVHGWLQSFVGSCSVE